jgi:hypothetical protein
MIKALLINLLGSNELVAKLVRKFASGQLRGRLSA